MDTKTRGESLETQLAHLLMLRERKEGQIRQIQFFKKGLEKSLDVEYAELRTLKAAIEKATRDISIIDEAASDIRRFLLVQARS